MSAGLSFTAYGRPIGQGAHRTTATGRTYEITKGHAPWRRALIAAATEAAGPDWQPIDGPVDVHLWCFGPRPKSHYGTGRNALVLKASAPRYPILKGGAINLHDIDHLERSVNDALKLAGIILDDAQIIDSITYKRFAELPDLPRADVLVTRHHDLQWARVA